MHDIAFKEVNLDYVVPLIIHGDDADAHRRRSFLVTTLGTPFVDGSLWDSRYLLYCLDNSRATSDTVKTLDQWVVWSLLELQQGFFFDRDPYGQPYARHDAGRKGPIANKYRGVLAVHKGDEKYLQKVYCMTKSAVSHKVCFVCEATQSGQNISSTYGPHAPHRATLMSTEQFIVGACGQQAWTRLPGWSVSTIVFDWLHLVDLCIVPECAASVTCLYLQPHI